MMTDDDAPQPLKPLLLRRSEAQRLLGISDGKYKQLVAQGELLEVGIGVRGRRLPYSELERFVARQLEKTKHRF